MKAEPDKTEPDKADRQAREIVRLRNKIACLEREAASARRLAAKRGWQVEEHRKELECLYAFSGIIQDPSRPVVEIAELLVDILPSGWLHPDLTCASITLEEMVFQSRDFAASPWRLFSEIIPERQSVGTIEVFYRGISRSNPFRAGEQELLDDITRRFARILRRKHAEETLREKEGYYREVFEKSNYGIAVTDSGKRFLDCNRAFLDLLGYESTEELQVCGYDEITPPEYKDAEDKFLRENSAETGYTEGFEKEFIRKNGDRIPVFIKVWPRRDIHQKPTGMYIIIRDRTRRLMTHESLRKRELELADKTVHLEEVNTALRVLLKHRDEDRLELERNVLTNIQKLVLPYLENLKTSHPDPRTAAFLQIMESNLKDIVSPFLSRLASSFSRLSPREGQVAQLVREGRTTKEIAEVLGVSSKAVDLYRNSIRRKLGIAHQKVNLKSYLSSLQ